MFPNLLNAKKIFFTHFFVLKFYLQFIADDKGYKLKKIREVSEDSFSILF